MRYTVDWVLKYTFTALLSAAILPAVGHATIFQAVLGAVVVSVLGFALVDHGVLPYAGEATAIVTELVLALVIYRFAYLLIPGMLIGWGGALVAAGALTLAEILFHEHLARTAPTTKV